MVRCSEFGERYLEVARGWSELHARQDPDAIPIVDADLAPSGPPLNYGRIEDVRADMEDLAGSVPGDEQDRELVERKLRSDVMYLRMLGGEAVDFIDYVEDTVGVTPELVSEDVIESGRQRLDDLLSERGLRYDRSHKQRFAEDRIVTGRADIQRAFSAGMAGVKQAAAELLPQPENDFFEVKYIHRDDIYWVGYLYVDSSGKIKLDLNTAKMLSAGRINTIAAHEYGGHALMLGMWRRAIEDGEMNPILGFTAAHTDFAFQTEAAAQGAEHFLLDNSWDNTFAAEHNAHSTRVMHNAHYMINTDVDPKKVAEYALERSPFDPTGSLNAKALVDTHKSNLLFRTYLMAYWPSLEAILPVHSISVEDQRRVLGKIYTQPMAPEQIQDLTSTLTG